MATSTKELTMGQRLICRKCNNGLYDWAEPERKDWENRKMKCEVCGFEETLKEFGDREGIKE